MTRRRRGTTTLPHSKIKKIMQADEDVGKIATATPLLVAKALECLMEDLMREAAILAIEKNAKAVQPAHLSTVVRATDTFDFLRHIIPEAATAAGTDTKGSKPKRPRAAVSLVPRRKKIRSAPVPIPVPQPPVASPVAVSLSADASGPAMLGKLSALTPLPPPRRPQDAEDDDDYDGEDDDDAPETAETLVGGDKGTVPSTNGLKQSPPAAPAAQHPPQSSAHRISVRALIS